MARGRTWIITGGAGFIGANTARALAARGIRPVILDDLSRATAELNLAWLRDELGDGFDFVRGDVRDPSAVEETIRKHSGAEAVLHLAAQVAVTTSIAEPRADFDVNAAGSLNVLEAVRALAPEAVFVYASTNKVYGSLEQHAIDEQPTRYVDLDHPAGIPETHPLDPHSPYGCSKATGDVYTLDYARIYGLRTVSLRQSCIYGPRQFGIEDQGWVAWFAFAAALGRPVTVYGTGKQVRDLLHVDDLADLYLRVVERAEEIAGRAYNVGGGPENTLSVLEALELLGERGIGAPTFAERRPGDQRVFVCDVGRLARDLDWRPSVPVERGVEELFDWVERHAADAARVLVGA